MNKIAPILLATILGALALFCIFGFLATLELSEAAKRLPWQIGYGLLFVVTITGAFQSLRKPFTN